MSNFNDLAIRIWRFYFFEKAVVNVADLILFVFMFKGSGVEVTRGIDKGGISVKCSVHLLLFPCLSNLIVMRNIISCL